MMKQKKKMERREGQNSRVYKENQNTKRTKIRNNKEQ